MYSTTPNDYLICLHLNEIGQLNYGPCEIDVPPYYKQPCSISFWFQANELSRKQVIANHGCKSPGQSGWAVYFEDRQLCFLVDFDGVTSADIIIPLPSNTEWRHFIGTIDLEKGKLSAFLDGSTKGWRDGQYGASFSVGSLDPAGNLLLGGYTDPAGGHFDHTFGRDDTGMIDDFRIYKRVLTPEEAATFSCVRSVLPVPGISLVPQSETAPTQVNFIAEISADLKPSIRHYLWDFGDGINRFGSSVIHDYPYAGVYPIKLTVISDDYSMSIAETVLKLKGRTNPLRFTPVFVNSEEGHACYRIPCIVRAVNGDLIAFAEGRLESCSDSTKTIRVVCKRSSDNGKTWRKVQVIAHNDIRGEEYVAQEPSPVVDRVHGTGRIILLFSKGEFNEWDSVKGLGIRRVGCFFSDDHGATWYGETDITSQVHKPYNPDYVGIYPEAALSENRTADWRKQIPARGHAIQLRGTKDNPVTRGRLFYAGAINRNDNGIFYSENYVFWSDDLGETWQIGGIIEGKRRNGASAKGLSEAMAVELESGDVLINSRNYQNGVPVNRRAITIGSFDHHGNIQFQPTFHDKTLIEPPVQASIIWYTSSDETQYGGKSRILFSNPAHERDRVNMTIRLSYDEGQTWPVSKSLDLGPSSYSDLVVLDDMSLGLLYERGSQGGIWFAHFDLEWLTDGKDSLNSIAGATP